MQLLNGMVEMSNADYHANSGISKSRLDEFAISPRHYWLKYVNPDRPDVDDDKEALIIGAASHCAVLEPDLFTQQYVMVPEMAPRKPTSVQLNAKNPSPETVAAIEWWKLFNDSNKGKQVLTADQYKLCLSLRDCVYADETAKALLANGRAEKSFFTVDQETGLQIKCRPDFLTDSGIVIDLKFVRDASPYGFAKACATNRYDVQSAYYPDLLDSLYGESGKVKAFVFIAIEKNEFGPVCAIYYASPEMIQSGRVKWRRELSALAKCMNENVWPGYTDKPQQINFPTYAIAQ